VGDLIALDQLTIDLRTDITQLRALWARVDYLQGSVLVDSDGDALTAYTNEEVTDATALVNAEIVILSQKITDGLEGMATVIGLNSLANSVSIIDGNLVTGDAASIVTAGLYTDAQIAAVNATIAGLPKITPSDLADILAQAGIDSGLLYDFLYSWLFNLEAAIGALPGTFGDTLTITNEAFITEYLRIYNELNGQFTNYSTIEQTANAINLKVGALEEYVDGHVSRLESGIEINASGITSAVSRLDYLLNADGTLGLVKTLETHIIQTAESLRLEASSVESQFGALTASVSSIEVKANAILTKVSSIYSTEDTGDVSRAEFDQEVLTRANADEAFTSVTTDLHASYHDPNTGLSTTVLDLFTAQADVTLAVSVQAIAVQAAVSVIDTYEARIDLMEGSVTDTMDIIANFDGVSIEELHTLEAKTFNSDGSLTAAMKLKVSDSVSQSSWGVTMDNRVGLNEGNINIAFEGYVDANGVLLKSLTEMVAEAGGSTGTVSEWTEVTITDLITSSEWGVNLTTNTGTATTNISNILNGYTLPGGTYVKGLTEISAAVNGTTLVASDWTAGAITDLVSTCEWGMKVVLTDSALAAKITNTFNAVFEDGTTTAWSSLEVGTGLNETEVTAKVTQILKSTNGNKGIYSLEITNGDVISGINFVSDYLDGSSTPISTFYLSTDVFGICAPESTAAVKPFTVDTKADGTVGVSINGSLVVTGSITGGAVNSNALLGDRQIDVAGWGAISIAGGSTGTVNHSLGRYPMVCLQDQISGQLTEITGTYFKIKNNDDHSKSIGYIYM